MVKYFLCLICITLIISARSPGQGGLNYQSTMISNPSVTGSAGNGILRLSYLNLYPGNSYNLHSVSLSYDSYFPSLHGGAGFYISDEYLGGIINNLAGGISYSYFLQASEKLYVSAGLSASFYHRGYDFSNAVLPDQIDPLLGAVLQSGETLSVRGKTVFDLATGIMFMSGKFFGGFSVKHLAEPDPSGTDYTRGNLQRMLVVHGAGDFSISRERNIRILPLASIETGKGIFSAAAGASLESKYLSVNAIILTDNGGNLDLQTGFSISSGNFMVFYSYRFNVVSGENLLPFSLQHHTGIALGLNNVDKRKTVKTINFPKL
ncbi:MAG: PorP/SprF family type IX secretion system membrane protein [Bacteroidia bacterium]|nr:PorP/SprF family type IX secretion system membrane protein [Bacteroidia bacterium]